MAPLDWRFVEERSQPWHFVPAVAAVLLAHVAGAWGLMQIDSVRAAVHEAAPLMIDMIAPAPPPPPPPPPPKLAKPPSQLAPPPPPALVVAAPTPAPSPVVFEAPPPPPVAPPPVMAPPAPPAPAPVAAPAPPAEPKTVSASAVSYLAEPAPVYPSFSRRARETGTVFLRVLIDERGLPRRVLLHKSSGSNRLDEAALAAMRAVRFRPYAENGVAQAVWAPASIIFELDN